MATRDLSVPFQRLRSALHRNQPPRARSLEEAAGSAGLLGAAAGADASSAAALSLSLGGAASPQYVEMVTEIQAQIQTIGAKMEQLGRAHDARLKIGFDPAAEQEREREIDILTSEITRTFHLGARDLKRLAKSGEQQAKDGTEGKVIVNVQRSLATQVHEHSTRFRAMQKGYLGQMKSIREGQSFKELLGGSGGGGGGGGGDRDTGFTDEQMHELASAEEDADERVREIQRIAKSVEELATLFKELATLVVEQGTILDRIDHNMEQTVVVTKKGIEELEQAEKYQKSARPIKCMLVLMVLIVVMTIVIVLRKTSPS
jgi:syntaxin 16